ncbi:MAG: glycosyltransferase family 4 protein [Chloroflexota bacterium]|nr:glycosyltransferase family 4 protein [Chloroflexota bacterium]
MAAGRLTVAIYAQLTPRLAGGIAEGVQQLVTQLSQLEGEESYVLVTSPEGADWLRPHLGVNQSLKVVAEHLSHTGPAWERQLAATIKRRARPFLPAVERAWERIVLPIRARLPGESGPPASDGLIESLGAGVVHFPYQRFIRTELPSIFEPWDLQHRHLPEFFTLAERRARDKLYTSACHQASSVIVASEWFRQDLMDQYAVPASKTLRVRRGPVVIASTLQTSELEITAIRQRCRIPGDFILYPAHLWPHKNHLRLLDALALLRDSHDTRIQLVCTGGIREYVCEIQSRIAALRLQDQVTFAGYVSQTDLAVLYRLAKLLAFPSLFEGYGFPLVEAMAGGLPIACSNVGSMPEIVGSAARLFDPLSAQSIADTILELWRNPSERERLAVNGRARSKLFDAGLAARTLRALYRELAQRPLTDEDRHLLQQGRAAATSRSS